MTRRLRGDIMMEIARQWVFSQIGGISPRSGNIHDIHNLTLGLNFSLFSRTYIKNIFLKIMSSAEPFVPHSDSWFLKIPFCLVSLIQFKIRSEVRSALSKSDRYVLLFWPSQHIFRNSLLDFEHYM